MQSRDAYAASRVDEVEVLFEDDALLAVNKLAGQVTHPAYRHPDGTLWDAVLARQIRLGAGRPWLLHRLDRETSGVVLLARTPEARRALVRQFERRTLSKRYLALVAGAPQHETDLLDAPLARDPSDRRRTIVTPEGQPSETRYWTLCAGVRASALVAEPLTGRTRQIRAHLAWAGTPLLGDTLYYLQGEWGAQAAPRAMLHAWRLTFRHPSSSAQTTITAPPPPDFMTVASQCGLADVLAAYLAQPQAARTSAGAKPE